MLFLDWLQPGLHRADDFLEVLGQERKCYIGGPLRSGKTLLSFVIADYWLKNDMACGIWSNIPHTMPKAPNLRNCVIILDEAGQFATAHADYSLVHDMYGRWAGKMNSIFLFPSVDKVQANLRNLSVIRVFDMDLLPVRILFYRWYYTLGSSGWFVLSEPEHYFGIYDTLFKPTNDGGTLEAIVAESPEAVAEMLESRKGISQLERLLEKYGYVTTSSNRTRSAGKSAAGVDPTIDRRLASLEGQILELRTLAAAADNFPSSKPSGLNTILNLKPSSAGKPNPGNGSTNKSAGYD